MSYTYTFDIHLGPVCAGLTLAARLVQTDGEFVSGEITDGFVEFGDNGDFLWTVQLPDDLRGGVVIYESGVPGTILAIGAINPEDVSPMTVAYEGSETLQDFLRLVRAVLLGGAEVSGNQVAYRDLSGNLDRVIVTHDRQGNRTQVVTDASDYEDAPPPE